MIDQLSNLRRFVDAVMDARVIEHEHGGTVIARREQIVDEAHDVHAFDAAGMGGVDQRIRAVVQGAKNATSAVCVRFDLVRQASWRPVTLNRRRSEKAGLVEIEQANGVLACGLLQFVERGLFRGKCLRVALFWGDRRLRLNVKPSRLSATLSVSRCPNGNGPNSASRSWTICSRVSGSVEAMRTTAVINSSLNARGRRPL